MVNDINPPDDMRVIPPAQSSLKITDEDKMKQNRQKKEQQQAKSGKKSAETGKISNQANDLETTQTMLKLRNAEQKLLLTDDEQEQKNISFEINKLKQQLLNEEKIKKQEENKQMLINNLINLKQLYLQYFKVSQSAYEAVKAEDYDDLLKKLENKKKLLNNIKNIQSKINFEEIKNLPAGNEKKAKAEEILSDIHKRKARIIANEDAINASLIDQKKEMKKKLANVKNGSRLLSGYRQISKKPRFIDTKG